MLDSFHLLIGINVKMKWRNSVWHLYESGNLEIFEEVAWDGTTHFLTFISLTLCFCWCFEAIFSGLWCENKGTKWCQERGAGSNTSQVSVWIRRASETCTEDFHVCSQQKKTAAGRNHAIQQDRISKKRDLRAADFWAPPLHLPIEQW